jgi:hypothetical protein
MSETILIGTRTPNYKDPYRRWGRLRYCLTAPAVKPAIK